MKNYIIYDSAELYYVCKQLFYKKMLQDNARLPARSKPVRFVVLGLVVLIALGDQYAFNNPQALQQSFYQILQINQSEFQLFYSMYALPNIFTLPFVGYYVDKFGVRISLITMSICLTLFQAVVALGGYWESYETILFGRIIYGIASQSFFIPQASIISFWFHGKQLAFALGIAITFPQFGNALNSVLTPIIFEYKKSLGDALMFSVFLCIIGIVCSFIVAYIDKKADKQDKQNLIISQQPQVQQIKLQDVKQLGKDYWLMALLCTVAMGMYIPFMDNVNRFYQKRFCFTQLSAGRVVTITYVMSGIVSLPIGIAVDKYGKRRVFITATMVIFLLAHAIILLYPQCIGLELYGATLGLFLIGVGYSGYANCMISSLPLVVKKKVIGTAFGLMQVLESIIQFVFPILTGLIVQNSQSPQIGYRYSSIFFCAIGFIGTLLCMGLKFLNPKNKLKLDKTSIAFQQLQKKIILSERFSSDSRSTNDLDQSLLSEDNRTYKQSFQIQDSPKTMGKRLYFKKNIMK